jgi:hypothetical protein
MGIDFSNGYEVVGVIAGGALAFAILVILVGYIIHKLSGGKIFKNEIPTEEEMVQVRKDLRQH